MRRAYRNGFLIVTSVLRRRIRIRALDGIVVVTRKGDPEDYLLRPGEELTIRTRGITAVRSLAGKAEVAVTTIDNRRHLGRYELEDGFDSHGRPSPTLKPTVEVK